MGRVPVVLDDYGPPFDLIRSTARNDSPWTALQLD